jgi:hypothetical protein
MRADPKPKNSIRLIGAQSAVMSSNAHRPKLLFLADFLEV